MEHEIPVGFRFYPTEVELISFYLRFQLHGGNATIHSLIPILDVFSVEPTQLPNLAGERCRGDAEQWLFFVPRQEREARGGRPSRTTGLGYWKATGSPGSVFSPDNREIGVKKTMVFYIGKAPTGRKTKWKMNEYKGIDETASSISTVPKGWGPPKNKNPPLKTLLQELVSTSPETSYSGGGDQSKLPVNASTTQTISEMVDGLSQPFWEWEQLNWS
ncbi:hypothetical protein N665_2369s0001 [Sinapis alba]|nr:hypothetical protein N665_2369s0001 [Sinapis alba]